MAVTEGLNLIWAVGALVAIGAVVLGERRRRSRLRDRCQRGFAVLMAAVALFPCISASDDMVRFGAMDPSKSSPSAISQTAQTESGTARTGHLARLLEALESFQIALAVQSFVALAFLAMVRVTVELAAERMRVAPTGRAPPQLAFAR